VAEARASGEAPPEPPVLAWYAVGVLTVAYTLSYIDRTILSLLVGPIRSDLNISDTQFSLLHGLAFACFYTVMGIPIGWLADRGTRRNIVAAGIAAWSLATAACGLARGFWQLFLARVMVGVGEAALSPAAYSMIADLFPRERVGRALGVYSSGVFIGIGASFLIGGAAIAWVSASPLFAAVPYEPWQITFFLVGLPGVLVALLALSIREPRRRELRPLALQGRRRSVRDALAWFAANRATYLTHFAGFATLTLVFNAMMTWAPEFFIRIHGMERPAAGFWLGCIVLVFGGLGITAGGLLSDWLSERGYLDAPLRAGLIGGLALVPFACTAPLIPDPRLSLILFCPLLFFASFPFSPAAAALQLLTPNHMRAQFSALYLFVVNLTGIGFGGTATALVTDYLFHDDQRLHHSMALVGGGGAALACVVLWFAGRSYERSVIAGQEHAGAAGTA